MSGTTIDLVRQKQLVEEHYAAFWSDAPDETLAAQLTPDFVDHAMPAGTVMATIAIRVSGVGFAPPRARHAARR